MDQKDLLHVLDTLRTESKRKRRQHKRDVTVPVYLPVEEIQKQDIKCIQNELNHTYWFMKEIHATF